MFDIGWSELLILVVVALLVVGPKELPVLMRTIGAFINKVKDTAGTFQRQFQAALDDTEVSELKSSLDELNRAVDPHELMSDITGANDFYDEFNEDEWDAAALMEHGETPKHVDGAAKKPNEGESGGSAAPIEADIAQAPDTAKRVEEKS